MARNLLILRMIKTSDSTHSMWQELEAPFLPALDETLSCDTCVIGAGIAGLTTAYFLALSGRKVVVIDDAAIGGRQSLRTTAHLSNVLDARYFKIKELHGPSSCIQLADNHSWAIAKMQEISVTEKIDCDFRFLDGYLFLDPKSPLETLKQEYAAVLESCIPHVELLSQFREASFELNDCLRFQQQAQFHPGKYLLGLARVITEAGGKIFPNTRAVEVHGGQNAFVQTKNSHKILCNNIIVATNVPINTRYQFHTKQAAYRSYVIACPVADEDFPNILLWDTAEPFHYLRKHSLNGKKLLLIGGEDHKTGQLQEGHDPYFELYAWAKNRFPWLQKAQYKWSGQIIESVDYLPYMGSMGEEEKNVYVVSGTSGNGMTYGTIAGKIICDSILGIPNKWAPLYDPSRITMMAAGNYLKENLNAGFQYKDWLEASAEKNPVCPHLGARLRWNALECTWDCPAHGSRFDTCGKMINGPAISDLHIETDEKMKVKEASPAMTT